MGRLGGCICGLNPERAYSAAMVELITFAVDLAGRPIAIGGARTLLAAFERLIRSTRFDGGAPSFPTGN